MGEDKPDNSTTSRRAAIVGSAVAAAVGVGAGVAAAKVGETEDDAAVAEGSFKVVDRRGKQRFLLETTKPPIIIGGKTYPAAERSGPDASYLLFNDENGNEKGGIVAAAGGAQISFDYPNGDAIHLGCFSDQQPGGASLEMNHMGDPEAPLEQARHPTGVHLSVDNEHGSALMLCDPQGRPRIRLQVAMDGTPTIAVLDEQGAVVRQL
ncbi:hypothetical protein [Nocardia sp. BMG51109]|uniref:hypothetical protein n=1 Tax=Nocardia sp. BMG51109 TaxID=1056816 RepID=UPI000464CB77|nr:hypothetical protein [Nocardia sp. BMG51109]